MSIKRYTPAGSGVARVDPKGEYVHYSDYLDLKSQPDALTAYLYAAELGKEDRKTLKNEVNRLTMLQAETLNERNKSEAQVERLRKAGDDMAFHYQELVRIEWGHMTTHIAPSIVRWNAAKEGKPSV